MSTCLPAVLCGRNYRMRKLVDTNFLQSDELRTYLTEPSNFAVLTDYTLMEVAGR